MTNTTLDVIQKLTSNHLDSAEKAMAKFQENFNTNPIYAFEWAASAMAGAQMKLVCMEIQHVLLYQQSQPEPSPQAVVDWIKQKAYEHLVRGIESRSTSVMTNEMARHAGASWAQVVDDLKWRGL